MKTLLLICSFVAAFTDLAAGAENRCLTGSKLGADGKVAAAKTTFAAAEPIHLTVQAARVPGDRKLTVEVLDAQGEEMKTIWANLQKDNSATVPIRNLEPGRYKAKAILDKKPVCEATFAIR